MLAVFNKVSNRTWFWFILTTVLFGIHTLTSRFYIQVYDSHGYWLLANILYNHGEFSLLNFDSPLRGYLLPLLLVPIPYLLETFPSLSEEVLIKIIGSILAGALFGVLFPMLWQRATGIEISRRRRLLFILAAFILWRDYFNYILTDFPAVAGITGTLLLLYPRVTAKRALLAGILVAAVTNIRPIYIAAVPFVALAFSLAVAKEEEKKWHLATGKVISAYFLGFVFLCLPQWAINHYNFNSNWPLVIGIIRDPAFLKSNDLYLEQINSGFTMQKYETSIAKDYPIPQVRYTDPAGSAILSLDKNKRIDSYGEYIQLVFSRPFDMISLNLRHLFNGLDILYPAPYIYRIYTSTAGIALFNYSVLFFAITLVINSINKTRAFHWLLLLPFLIPAVLMIPLPMECRYLMPVHLILIAVAVFGWPAHLTWQGMKGRRLALLIGYLAFVGTCFMLSANTQAMLGAGIKLLS